MRIPINWLKEYIDIKDSAETIADKLLMSGTEAELIKSNVDIDENVVVGEVLEVVKHPNADRLNVAKADAGNNKLQIVCGGINLAEGQKVPLALIGAKIGDFEIKETEIRGVKSFGMICSESELGLSDESNGEIMVLDASLKNGARLKDALGKGGDVIEAEITPNRGDCLSIIGIARELSAITGKSIKNRETRIKEADEKAADLISVDLKEKELCPRYVARVLKIKENAESPKWMRERLEQAGVRPISAVVDVTNYVMLETGQPLHAFDMQKLKNKNKNENENLKIKELIVRKAKDGEGIETLDGVKRKLIAKDLIIADSKGPIAIAGVMGGKNTEVDEKTKTIILESATFDAVSVRKTAQRLALRSESSNRFEKGIPMELNVIAIDRAAELIQEVCGGEVLRGQVDVKNKEGKSAKIKLNILELQKFLGQEIKEKEITEILKRLGFEVKGKGDLVVTPPYFRLDISIKEDLYEEIARIYGYNNIKSTLPKGEIPLTKAEDQADLIKTLKNNSVATGFTEVLNYSFVDQKSLDKLGQDTKKSIKVDNPISKELEYMRTSLLPSLLKNISLNQNNFSEVKIFEIAHTYIKNGKELPTENYHMAGAVLGGDLKGIRYRDGKEFYILRGALENIFSGYEVELKKGAAPYLDNKKVAEIFVNGKNIGFIGELSRTTSASFDIKKKIAVFEVNLSELSKVKRESFTYKPFVRLPSIKRDLAFTFAQKTEVGSILKLIEGLEAEIIKNFEIIDIYSGKELEGKKSVAIRIEYQHPIRTLRDREVAELETKIVNMINKRLGGKLRDAKEGKTTDSF